MDSAEMMRRLDSMPPAVLAAVWAMILEGYGGSGIAFETSATIKQINAVFAWHSRYGRVSPLPAIFVSRYRNKSVC